MAERKTKWITEAADYIFQSSEYEQFVFRNAAIEEFLRNDLKYFVIASKGVGKTLLLINKRMKLSEEKSGNIFIPSDKPYIDVMASIQPNLSSDMLDYISDWKNCRRLWLFAIQLSALSFSTTPLFDVKKYKRSRHHSFFQEALDTNTSFGEIFNNLISLSYTELMGLLNEFTRILDAAYRTINYPLYYFFDRIDQALEDPSIQSPDLWIAIQVGLLEAAWEANKNVNHVKIYLSIRQEAYYAYSSANKQSMFSNIIFIKYSSDDLKHMLNQLINFYESKRSLDDFLEISYFKLDSTTGDHEEIYRFMNRYSLGRPRDFVCFCHELSIQVENYHKQRTSKKKMTGKERLSRSRVYKEIIINTTNDQIITNIHSQLNILLKCLKDKEDLEYLLSIINTNILDYNEMITICKQYNDNRYRYMCSGECSKCSDDHHPFCDLYNMGLLGYVYTDPTTTSDNSEQKFKSPYETITKGLNFNTKYYFIHPALRSYINLVKTNVPNATYRLSRSIIVGDECIWRHNYESLLDIEQEIVKLGNKLREEYWYGIVHNLKKLLDKPDENTCDTILSMIKPIKRGNDSNVNRMVIKLISETMKTNGEGSIVVKMQNSENVLKLYKQIDDMLELRNTALTEKNKVVDHRSIYNCEVSIRSCEDTILQLLEQIVIKSMADEHVDIKKEYFELIKTLSEEPYSDLSTEFDDLACEVKVQLQANVSQENDVIIHQLEHSVSLRNELEITIPIIPLLLSYKTHLSIDTQLKLKAFLKKCLSRIRKSVSTV